MAFLALIALARNQSPAFETCMSNQAAKSSTAQEIKSPADTVVPFIQRWPISIRCTGAFLDENNAPIAAFATLVIAVFTIVLAVATSRQADLTREALIADKRAFVFAVQISPVWEKVRDQYHWRLRPVLRNSGSTPTKRLRIYVDCEIRNSVLPPDFNFRHDPSQIGSGLLPPQYESPAGQAPRTPGAAISPQDIIDTQQGRKFIYLWGWARYNDVFPGTPEHITQYYWFITTVGDPMIYDPAAGPGTLQFHFLMHPSGNYADEPDS